MPVVISNDLRGRIVWMCYYKEIDCKEIAELLYVHISTVYRVLDRYNQYGTVVPVVHRNGPMVKQKNIHL